MNLIRDLSPRENNWDAKKEKADGVVAVYLKALTIHEDGSIDPDPKLDQCVADFRAEGIMVGLYFVPEVLVPIVPQVAALRAIATRIGGLWLPPMIDAEWLQKAGHPERWASLGGVSKVWAKLDEIVGAMIAAFGCWPFLYFVLSFANDVSGGRLPLGLRVLLWAGKESVSPYEAVITQSGEEGDGIDCDQWNRPLADLQAMLRPVA